MTDDAKILFWDSEYSPNFGAFWGFWEQNISLNMVDDTQRMLCFGYRWKGKKSVTVVDERAGRLEMLTHLRDTLTEADLVVSWNGQRYDTRMANREFLKEGLTPPAPYKELDLMRVVKSRFAFGSNKLDWVAKELGVGAKAETGGYQLWRDVMAGDEAAWRKMHRYQKQDVNLLVDLADKLTPWVKMPHPVSSLPGLVCRNCGGTHLNRRGVARTLQGEYPRYQCMTCGTWQKGTHRTPVGDTRVL